MHNFEFGGHLDYGGGEKTLLHLCNVTECVLPQNKNISSSKGERAAKNCCIHGAFK